MQLLRIDWNVVFTIINLIVLYLALRKFLIKPVTNIMEQRKQMIEGEIADARKEKDKAYDLKAQYEDKLTQAHKESSEIIEKARKSAQTEYNNKVSVASAEADRIIKDAHKAVELDRERQYRIYSQRLQDLLLQQQKKYWVNPVQRKAIS